MYLFNRVEKNVFSFQLFAGDYGKSAYVWMCGMSLFIWGYEEGVPCASTWLETTDLQAHSGTSSCAESECAALTSWGSLREINGFMFE